jgi:hypothetical protein
MWNYILLSLTVIGLIIKDILKFCTPEYIYSIQNPFWKLFLGFVAVYQIQITITLTACLALISGKGHILEPRNKINKIKKGIVERVNLELFNNDLKNNRVTLFKEIGYFRACYHHFIAAAYHLFECPEKFLLYCRWLPRGRYLIVDTRVGLECPKSTTMFRVEANIEKKCEGVVGFIRYSKSLAVITDLPDLSAIDFDKVDVKNGRTGLDHKVRSYMARGYIRNFETMKKIHRHARHFCGTIIQNREGKIWGVLLVDSTDETSSYSKAKKERFESFAITLGDIL